MAEKDTKPKATVKPAANSAKTTSKPATPAAGAKTAAPKTAAKPSTTAKPAATAVKPSATATKAATAKPATNAVKSAAAPAPKSGAAAENTAGKKVTVIDAKPAGKTAATAKKETTSKSASTAPKTAATISARAKQPAAQPAKPAAQVNKPVAAATGTAPKGAEKTVAAEKAKPAAMTKPAASVKPDKQKKAKTTKKNGGSKSASVVAMVKNNKIRVIAIAAVAFVLVLAIILGIVLGAKSCNKPGNGSGEITIPTPDRGQYAPAGDLKPGDPYETVTAGKETVFTPDEIVDHNYNTDNKTNTVVGYYGQQTGTVKRVIPEKTRDEGLGVYPKYGYTLSTVIGGGEKEAMRTALINESSYLTATGTWNAGGGDYKWMDKDGMLYKGTTADPEPTLDKFGNHRRLYKHSASVGLYMGDVSDDEPGIIKRVTMRPRSYTRGYGVTGVYAPAGEVIKIQMSEADMNATGGIVIHLGQALYNGKANNIWTAKGQMQRIPHLLNTMVVDKNTATLEDGVYTAYVGTFIGGPIYIRNESVTFTATISGGVTYSHFILGYTTQEEFEQNAKSSAPYFDLEVWDNGVLHSGPKSQAKNLTYDDIYKAAVLWDKVATVTTTGNKQGIVFLYDPFVAAGAAVAFPGQGSVNCPMGWMSNSLNYNTIVSSGGWGNFHEYHHNFQGYGVGNGGEVTNNGMTLVSYALFTKISSHRGISGFGSAGLGGWNSYTSATWALEEVLKIARPNENPSNGNQGLALYATLLHNFGPDAYIKAKVKGGGQSYQAYANAWEHVTHNNMTYYFNEILKGGITSTAPAEYPMFVPVSSVYQTGRSYTYDGQKKYITTMQPYVIPKGRDFIIDLSKYTAPGGQYASGSVVIPDGFEYTVKSVSTPASGTIEKIDDLHYKFKPGNLDLSGDIKVTLGITKTDNAFKVADVDLTLQFEQSAETYKSTLTRTTYTYSTTNMYTDAQTAYESNFAGFTGTPVERDHKNPVQNSNTDIWFYPNNDSMHQQHPDAPEEFFVHPNTIDVVDGKLYFEEEGKYRIYMRGRTNCAVYYSLDGGKTYQLGATIKDKGTGSGFYVNDPETYFDLELSEHSWVYFKEILIVQDTPAVSFIGLGYGKWTAPMFTMTEDEDGKTHYFDYQGNEVTEEEANNAAPIAPTKASYINGYNTRYDFPSNESFKSDYFYVRDYTYTYNDLKVFDAKQTCIAYNYQPWDNTPTHAIGNLFDDDDNTYIHSNKTNISEANPFMVEVKLNARVTANRLVFHGSGVKSGYATFLPKKFKVWVKANEADEWTLVSDVAASTLGKLQVVANFEEYHTFSYYKVQVTDTHSTGYNKYICLNKIEVSSILTLAKGKLITPDNEMFNFEGDWTGKQTASFFGHVYAGSNGSTLSYQFTGKRFGIVSSAAYGSKFEVTIDGKVVPSIELKKDDGAYFVSYISSELTSGTHSVVIKCVGNASIDSIILYD